MMILVWDFFLYKLLSIMYIIQDWHDIEIGWPCGGPRVMMVVNVGADGKRRKENLKWRENVA
jgi:hypothetical protein